MIFTSSNFLRCLQNHFYHETIPGKQAIANVFILYKHSVSKVVIGSYIVGNIRPSKLIPNLSYRQSFIKYFVAVFFFCLVHYVYVLVNSFLLVTLAHFRIHGLLFEHFFSSFTCSIFGAKFGTVEKMSFDIFENSVMKSN